MSKKDYEMIAGIIRQHRDAFGDAAGDALAEMFATALANRNAAFNYARFIAATWGRA